MGKGTVDVNFRQIMLLQPDGVLLTITESGFEAIPQARAAQQAADAEAGLPSNGGGSVFTVSLERG